VSYVILIDCTLQDLEKRHRTIWALGTGVARTLRMREVVGSNPTVSTFVVLPTAYDHLLVDVEEFGTTMTG
jgi:hypothetical protein